MALYGHALEDGEQSTLPWAGRSGGPHAMAGGRALGLQPVTEGSSQKSPPETLHLPPHVVRVFRASILPFQRETAQNTSPASLPGHSPALQVSAETSLPLRTSLPTKGSELLPQPPVLLFTQDCNPAPQSAAP